MQRVKTVTTLFLSILACVFLTVFIWHTNFIIFNPIILWSHINKEKILYSLQSLIHENTINSKVCHLFLEKIEKIFPKIQHRLEKTKNCYFLGIMINLCHKHCMYTFFSVWWLWQSSVPILFKYWLSFVFSISSYFCRS